MPKTASLSSGPNRRSGWWIFARWAPGSGSPLHGVVQHAWYFDGVLANARERVFPDGTAELIARNDMRNAGAIMPVAIRWLEERIAQALDGGDSAVRWTADAVRRTQGNVRLEAVASHLGVAQSRLSRRFCELVGVMPKRFPRITRFHNALRRIGRGEDIAVAAADLGYYDQAHLYRDFSEFAGMTPAAFIASTRYPGGVSLAES